MTQQDIQRNARVRVRVGDKEIEVEGAQDFVGHQTLLILQEMGVKPQKIEEVNRQLALPISDEVIEADFDENEAEEQPLASPSSSAKPGDLLDFFEEKSPHNQNEQVLVITAFYTKILGREDMSLEDYTEAFTLLKRLAVDTPANMKSTVRNVVDRTKYLYNPARGRFALTVPGEKLIEGLPSAE